MPLYQPFNIPNLNEVVLDLNLEFPLKYNIRVPRKGIFESKHGGSYPGDNRHCLMLFEKIQ